jgi:hypothetical protein
MASVSRSSLIAISEKLCFKLINNHSFRGYNTSFRTNYTAGLLIRVIIIWWDFFNSKLKQVIMAHVETLSQCSQYERELRHTNKQTKKKQTNVRPLNRDSHFLGKYMANHLANMTSQAVLT